MKPKSGTAPRARALPFKTFLLLCCCLSIAPATLAAAASGNHDYGLRYTLKPEPATGSVQVVLTLSQDTRLLREMNFAGGRVTDLAGDGDLQASDGRYSWVPPAKGGELSWRASARHQRNRGGYDAWLDGAWGLFRAEDVIPRAATRAVRDARSDTVLAFDLPKGWSAVSQYRAEEGRIAVTSRGRRFTQPSGWIVVGELGVRREKIAGTHVAIAAPVAESVRRMDALALLNWTLPELVRILPEPLPRLTIVSAGEPMWHGGLSAPQSLFIHAERPLISENGTSTLLHEVMHVATGSSAENGYDWIVEGIAEYYSLELLRRSGSITLPRYQLALKDLEVWSRSGKSLCSRASNGPETARAVLVLRALDAEVHKATGGKSDLDDILTAMLAQDRKFTLEMLRTEARAVLGRDAKALADKKLPGCTRGQASG